MSGRFLTKKDLLSVKRHQEVLNSMIKRGELKKSDYASTRYVVCGCGVEGCGFFTKNVSKNS